MAQNIKLADFNINIDDVVKSATELKKSIDKIKEAQKQARKEGKADNEQYVENEAILKSLNSEYRQHIKALSDNIKATADSTNRTELLNAVLDQEVLSIKQAREQNKLLTKLRNDTNLATEEGRKELELLNKTIDLNNDFIKENVDGLSKQKINVGNYTESVKEALTEMNPFNQSITVFISNVEESGGVTQFFSKNMKSLSSSILGVTKAALSFLATPIGAVIGAIGIAVGLVVNALNRSEASTQKLTKAFSGLTGIFQGVLKALEPIGKFLIDVLVKNIELAEKGFFKAAKGISNALKFIGFDDAAKSVDNFTNGLKESSKQAKALQQAQKELTDAQRVSRGVQLDFQRDAEKLRQTRDDETKSFSERIKANEQLGVVLKNQLNEELNLAQTALKVANLRLQAEGQTTEALDARADALNEIKDIQERITGQESEQLTNRVSLQKEAVEKQIQLQKDALDLFIAEQGTRARTLSEELKLEEETSEKRKAILKAELNAKKLSQDAYQKELLNIESELGKKRAEITVNNALREVEANKRGLELQRENAQFLSAELAEQRKKENNNILLQEQELFKLRLEKGLINQQEFDTAIRELSESNRILNKEIDEEREQLEKEEKAELRAIEFEQELIKLQEEGASRFEIEQAQRQEQNEIQLQQLQEQRDNGLISENLFLAKRKNINDKFNRDKANFELKNEEQLASQRIQLAQNLFSALGEIVDKNSSFGKALAVSQALINTYQGISNVWSEKSEAGFVGAGLIQRIATTAVVAAQGFATVKKIVSTKVPKADGGSSSGGGVTAPNIGAGTGAGSQLSNLSSNQSNLSQVAGSGNVAVQNQINNTANNAGLADSVSNAVKEGAKEGTMEGSQEGLTNLSDNKQIENLSSF